MTFSIVAFDRATGDLGIAVASKFLGVGAVVPWAKAGVGAIATQAFANTRYGPRGLELLESGNDAQQTIDHLLAEDQDAEIPSRQVGVVDASGNAASYTGPQCHTWAGGRTGPGYACQGNILAGQQVTDAMAHAFEAAQAPELAERLLDALAAGQEAGGDARGQQSAALYVVREHAGYGGRNDRYIDARVDDHRQPIEELKRIVQLWRVYFQTPNPQDMVALSPDLIREVQHLLKTPQTASWDGETQRALRTWAGRENLEERLRDGGIDPIVLRLLRERAQ